ncbi:hypothetical protein HmCmsJML164_01898 [Escherichia coli]|nr:hypothetical protein HmCmsJML164_01898 [Escherichia coli]
MFAEVIHNHLHLLRDIVVVQCHPLVELNLRPFAIDLAVFVFQLLQQLIRHFVVGVVFQHIEDKAFFDCLAHGVDVEGLRFIGF